MKTKLNKRKCKNCKEVFQKNSPLQYVCSPKCGAELARKQRVEKEKKESKAHTRDLRASLLTHKDYIQRTQKVFNTYVRMRDKAKPCVSCGCDMTNRKGDASHYFAAGSNPNVRFNEDNVHLSCVPCNQYAHGNLIEYGLRLPSRIGEERFKALHDTRNVVRKYTITELKEMIVHYKQLIKELK